MRHAPEFESLEERILMSASPVESQEDGAAVVAALVAEPAVQVPATSELVFIDASVLDSQELLSQTPAGAEIHVLQPDRDGIEQITELLEGRRDVAAMHIITHGSPGLVHLGSGGIALENVERTAAWRSALAPDADILIYGCEVGKGEVGTLFVQALAEATQADVAASDDDTGVAALGGDWEMEIAQGAIEAAALQAFEWNHLLATYNFAGGIDSGNYVLLVGDIFNVTADTTLSGSLSGSGGFDKTGTAILVLSGTSTYAGNTTVSAGTLALGASGVIPDGSGNGNVSIGSSGTLDLNGFSETINGLSSSGKVTNSGASAATLTVGGNNASSTFGGTFQAGSSSLFLTKTGSGNLTLYSANPSGLAGVTIDGGAILRWGDFLGADKTVIINNTGRYYATAGGTINQNFDINSTSGATSVTLESGSGAYTLNGTIITSSDAKFGTNNYNSHNHAHAFNGKITGSGGITLAGHVTYDRFVLNNAANDFAGDTTITAGTLTIGASGVIPDGSGKGNVSLGVNGRLDLNGFNETINGLSGSGKVTNSSASSSTLTAGGNDATSSYSGVVQDGSGTLSLVKTGSGTLTLTGSNTFTGTTDVNAGTLALSGSGSLYTGGTAAGSININNGGTLLFSRNDSFGTYLTSTPVLLTIGAGGVVSNGAYFTTLNNLTMNGGELRSTGGLNSNYGSYQLKGTVTVSGSSASAITSTGTTNALANIQLGNNVAGGTTTFNVADVTGDANADLSADTAFVDDWNSTGTARVASGLVKTGAGTMVLTGTNTYTGATSVSEGELAVTGSSNASAHSVASGASISGGSAISGSIGNLNFEAASSKLKVNAISASSASKLSCSTLSAASGFTVDVGAVTQPGTYDILVSTSGTPTPVLGSNATGARVTFEWVGNTLKMHVSPTIDSATYDAATGTLVATGKFLAAAGAANDIDASLLTLTGEDGSTYTLTDTPDADISSATSFTLVLSATDQAAVNTILNKNGISSTSGTAFNLAAAEDWDTGFAPAGVDADLAGNAVTVANVAVPAISSATYDAASGVLTVTGSGFLKLAGAANDIDVTKLSLEGEGESYTLTGSSVEISSGTSFSVTLNATDKAAVNQFLNKNGLNSSSGTAFNLAAAEDWAGGADAAVLCVDATSSVTVANVAVPAISSATYDAAGGVLTVTGSGFLKLAGAANDIDVSKLSLEGEGESYTLTGSSVELSSGTGFSVTLNATDKAAVNQFLNKNGLSATSGLAFNLAAAEDWAAGADAAVVTADLINDLMIHHVGQPSITSATYDTTSGTLTVTGIGFFKLAGGANDIDVTKLRIMGEGGVSYGLTSDSVEIINGSSFIVTVNSADKAALNPLLNKNGASSSSGTIYNLAANEDWAAGADPSSSTVDASNNLVVSNVMQVTHLGDTIIAGTQTSVVGNRKDAFLVHVIGAMEDSLLGFKVNGVALAPGAVTALGSGDYSLNLSTLSDSMSSDLNGFDLSGGAWAANGDESITIVAVENGAGNTWIRESAPSNSLKADFDSVASSPNFSLVAMNAGNAWNYTVTGTAEAYSSVRIMNISSSGGPGPLASGGALPNFPIAVTADANGRWSTTLNLANLPDGTLTFVVNQTDYAGNVSNNTTVTTLKNTNNIVAVGVGDVTPANKSAYRISGYAKPGTKVQVTIAGKNSAWMNADPQTGAWTGTINFGSYTASNGTALVVTMRQIAPGGTIISTINSASPAIAYRITGATAPTSTIVDANPGSPGIQSSLSSLTISGSAGSALINSQMTIALQITGTATTRTLLLSASTSGGLYSLTVDLSQLAQIGNNVTAYVYYRDSSGRQSQAAPVSAIFASAHNTIKGDPILEFDINNYTKSHVKCSDPTWEVFMALPSLTQALESEVDAFDA
jgi:autotransporter-associated beta strand protein